MKSLVELGAGLPTDKETTHSYLSGFYERALAPYRYRPAVVVEVGIWSGGCIELWLKAFPQATIWGIEACIRDDVDPTILPHVVQENAYTPSCANRFSKTGIDVFIDDGSHLIVDQLQAMQLYLPQMNPGGLFVIEDVQSDADFAQLTALGSTFKLPWGEYRTDKQRDDRIFFLRAGQANTCISA